MKTESLSPEHQKDLDQTHTHTLGFHVLWGLPIDILYKPYIPSRKPTHHRKLPAFSLFQITSFSMISHGDQKNVPHKDILSPEHWDSQDHTHISMAT